MSEKEAVNHPSHYNQGEYEVIDVIHDWDLGFDLGNAIKYIARAGHKDPSKEVEDLKKAIFYIKDRIKRIEGEPSIEQEVENPTCLACGHPLSAHKYESLTDPPRCTIHSQPDMSSKSVRCDCGEKDSG
jgi:hypothetical protein